MAFIGCKPKTHERFGGGAQTVGVVEVEQTRCDGPTEALLLGMGSTGQAAGWADRPLGGKGVIFPDSYRYSVSTANPTGANPSWTSGYVDEFGSEEAPF